MTNEHKNTTKHDSSPHILDIRYSNWDNMFGFMGKHSVSIQPYCKYCNNESILVISEGNTNTPSGKPVHRTPGKPPRLPVLIKILTDKHQPTSSHILLFFSKYVIINITVFITKKWTIVLSARGNETGAICIKLCITCFQIHRIYPHGKASTILYRMFHLTLSAY